jgi:hypothetical protein
VFCITRVEILGSYKEISIPTLVTINTVWSLLEDTSRFPDVIRLVVIWAKDLGKGFG